ncbi:MAG: hypothetical protein LBO66_09490 [Deltaproteobacteria bacterium]|jgi:hypothetical protein|nr:hypothetical protein [Deltaproteobacteria bacterium]
MSYAVWGRSRGPVCGWLAVLGALAFIFSLSLARASRLVAFSDCQESSAASAGKIEREITREEDRREEGYPESAEEESLFADCLGGIYGGSDFPGFPPLPDLESQVDRLCREARRQIGAHVPAYPSHGGVYARGGNQALPWNGGLSEDIFDSLR